MAQKSLRELFPGKEPRKIGPLDPRIQLILEIYSLQFQLALLKGEEYRRTCKDRFGECAA